MFCYIYKIIKNDAQNDDMIYIGSSCDPDERWQGHKKVCNNPKRKEYNLKVYKYIRDNGGIEEWQMIILDEFEIPLKKCVERYNYEKDYIIKYDATNKLNIILTGRKKKEYNKDNKEKIKESCKKYREQNVDKIKEYLKNNKEKIKEYHKEYREENAEKIKENNKEYREKNADKIKEYQNEKVCCNICGSFSTKSNITRHQRSNKCINFNIFSS